MYVCMYVYIYIHLYTFSLHTHTHTHSHTHSLTHAHTHTCIYTSGAACQWLRETLDTHAYVRHIYQPHPLTEAV